MVALVGLRQARQQAAMSQQELSVAAGVRQATISQLEIGATRARPTTVRRLAQALGVAPVVLQKQPGGAGEQAR